MLKNYRTKNKDLFCHVSNRCVARIVWVRLAFTVNINEIEHFATVTNHRTNNWTVSNVNQLPNRRCVKGKWTECICNCERVLMAIINLNRQMPGARQSEQCTVIAGWQDRRIAAADRFEASSGRELCPTGPLAFHLQRIPRVSFLPAI